MTQNLISINKLSKTYSNGLQALKDVSLDIKKGEIIAMLGPNGAGKTTLISIICGIVTPSSGEVNVDGFDIIKNYRETRSKIGLVPQELTLENFETVFNNVSYTRGLYGKAPNAQYVEKILKDLYLWDKKDDILRQLSGGMKRRVLIAKALSHEPKILFLDEPTASVDVELRKDMWEVVKRLKKKGVTIILTTHYIEEAEEIADRVGIISDGKIIIVDEKNRLINKLGQKILNIELNAKLDKIPKNLVSYNLKINDEGTILTYVYDTKGQKTGITSLLTELKNNNIQLKDISTEQSSLESIFLNLLKEKKNELARP